MSDDSQPAWRKRLETSLDELETLGQQVAQQLGESTQGARREVAEAWHRLEPRIGEAKVKLRDAADDAVEHLEGMFGELRASLRSLGDELRGKDRDAERDEP
ncbi:MAG: hypothetical protein H6712_13740 [Myxococcales bacterium]|nr:hypothetical protein [Myxococcales bacterium]MCB9714924.1 hypothetical protein [Myxococcales bacterium]